MSKDTARDLEGQLIALVGGSGFIGTHVAQSLLARGARLRVCSRHPERGYRLKTLGGLGKIQLVAVDVTKPQTLEVALTGCDAVVNLVGAFTGKLQGCQGFRSCLRDRGRCGVPGCLCQHQGGGRGGGAGRVPRSGRAASLGRVRRG